MNSTAYALLSDRLVLAAVGVFVLAMVVLAVERARWTGAVSAAPGAVEPRVLAPTAAALHLTTVTTQGHGELGDPPEELWRSTSIGTARAGGRIGLWFLGLGAGLLLGAIVARGIAAGRAPWSNMYEFVMVGTLTTVLSYLILAGRARTRAVGAVGVWVAVAAALFLGLAITVLYTPAAGLIPVLDSAWLIVHVAAAIVAGGLFTVGALVSVLYLASLRRRGSASKQTPAWSSDTLDQAAQTAYTIAFPIWTFAVIAGAIWAENSWGRYWGWDPKETWAFITWVLYAAYLHAQATGGWRGKKATWLALAGYVAFLFNFIGVNVWVGGLHSYSGV